MANQLQDKLIEAAIATRGNAYAPYSKFPVGAAVLAEDGSIFAGANVENVSYGLTICAERVATASAVSAGHRKLLAVAIVSDSGAPPCGACRQFLAEFGGSIEVILVEADQPENVQETTLDKLLPEQFKLE
ncbi:MAG: cytidine deaminase [Planctomycetes bacterium]|nr:cytidine deaminase [Planctomycetota bacterium]